MPNHICGFYYVLYSSGYPQRYYLPQVGLKSHTKILAQSSRTVLTQSFKNPSQEKGIKEIRYTFPLYDGVSVVGFTCQVGKRVIKGLVKERQKAKKDYQEAVAKGQTAGLLEALPEASDVFTTTVGNVPPNATIMVEITYLGELKHDAEVNGIRFTIPTSISPRYGHYPGQLAQSTAVQGYGGGSIEITVDATVAADSFIQKILSPSHPIAVSMGTVSTAERADPVPYKASATLSLGTAELEKDFILQLVAKDTGVPTALCEKHPTLNGHRAVMATLVPRFSLRPEKPEIVFIIDRSGSMSGKKITTAVNALKVFLKSLPVGVKFNICSFGSHHSFLFDKSKTYDQESLDLATLEVDRFQANFGGTEMYQPIEATIKQRYKDIPLEIMLLTDGEIWDQQKLFDYLNREIVETDSPIRVFTLGVGNEVSHSLIEGLARAGNGFSQAVSMEEKLESKVVRMLKGALSPHVADWKLQINTDASQEPSKEVKMTDEDDDDFEIVEKETKSVEKKPISLFDTSVDPDEDGAKPEDDKDGMSRYAHLPSIKNPDYIQAPNKLPPLFAFNRTTAYVLFDADSVTGNVKSITLSGKSKQGPLELEIKVQELPEPGETLHQLAAKRAIAELEDGRGWPTTTREDGQLIRDKHEGHFSDIVEREAVRLGTKYQVGGKWCSFVAVEENPGASADADASESSGYLDDPASVPDVSAAPKTKTKTTQSFGRALKRLSSRNSKLGAAAPAPPPPPTGGVEGFFGEVTMPITSAQFIPQSASYGLSGFSTGVDTASAPPPSRSQAAFSSANFSAPKPKAAPQARYDEDDDEEEADADETKKRAWYPPERRKKHVASWAFKVDSAGGDVSGGLPGAPPRVAGHAASLAPAGFMAGFVRPELDSAPAPAEAADPLRKILALQTFGGFWELGPELLQEAGVAERDVLAGSEGGEERRIAATLLALRVLEVRLAESEDVWELVAEKARGWLEGQDEGVVEEMRRRVEGLVK